MKAPIEAIAAGLTQRGQRRGAPKGLYRLFTFATGKEILVVGPSSAGKTKFTEYLRLGTLDPAGLREMTYHVRKSRSFIVGIGQEDRVVLRVRRAVDTPGQVGPWQHGSLVGRRKPHAVVVVLDCSTPVATTIGWLRLFASRLDTVLRDRHYVRRKLNEIIVLLNKRDTVDSDHFEQLRENVQEVLGQHLSMVLGAKLVQAIPVTPCISIQTDQGTILIDRVINYLAERLTYPGRPVDPTLWE